MGQGVGIRPRDGAGVGDQAQGWGRGWALHLRSPCIDHPQVLQPPPIEGDDEGHTVRGGVLDAGLAVGIGQG